LPARPSTADLAVREMAASHRTHNALLSLADGDLIAARSWADEVNYEGLLHGAGADDACPRGHRGK
jgi:hypothetical protein